jgi:nucleoid DNA-binding protein
MNGKTVTKANLVEEIAKESGLTKLETKKVVDGFIDKIIDIIAQGDRIELRGFGVFKSKSRKPRMARNPKTGDLVPLEERYVPVFKPSPSFFKTVNEGINKK